MAVSPIPQAPFRQDRKVFLTPIIGDVLFSEVRDCSRIEFPEYGTPHPDSKKWPDHKLVFIKSVDIERDGLFEFFYAADRANQDLYNFSFATRNIGGREFRSVTRAYVTPRADFDPLVPAFNTEMPDVPEGKFDGVTYLFYDKAQQRIDQQELDALFVAEIHTYVERDLLEEKLSSSVERPVLTPEKFRALLPTITSEELVAGTVETPTLGPDDIASIEEQVNTDVKRVRTTTRDPQTETVVLSGTRAYVEGTDATTEETYSPTELSADTGLLIAQSSASPLGDGSFVKETIRVGVWPELKSAEWDYELNTAITRTEQFVAPPENLVEPNTTFRAVNKDRTLKIVEQTPATALLNYLAAFPTDVSLQLPSILQSVAVVWSQDSAVGESDSEWDGVASGTSYSLSGSESGSASSSASVQPELLIDIQQPSGSNLAATAYFFYIETNNNVVTEAMLLDRLALLCGSPVSRWPIFRPVSRTVVTQGAKVSVRADAQGSASVSFSPNSSSVSKSTTEGTSYDVGLRVSATNIPPTLHAALVISGNTNDSINVSANATAGWIGTNFPTVNISTTATHTARAQVAPTGFPATSPPDIPRSGLYVIQSRVEPFKWGWAKCSATVLDAQQLA